MGGGVGYDKLTHVRGVREKGGNSRMATIILIIFSISAIHLLRSLLFFQLMLPFAYFTLKPLVYSLLLTISNTAMSR